ncbi:MAG: hypothetical protein COV85_03455 [Candidatus Portnoybacteria bacterium CG11_big_fil_rev_8_21_14_0_20_44_10]|uniref:Uncharacterized protein n=1 Tax=Candidatus Portnoybacteria bacterium CG11_big_fil_rev_8_21_14_0_20_44_10 TaxID=1974818 RepID=A0A2H0KPY9_9BACT|nr:MAG: hypothetical protein COV85_03455 [Candidatus Portnoybacteria bacterium CG11_big_fil_rev_8_21_14_0_20_44_10]
MAAMKRPQKNNTTPRDKKTPHKHTSTTSQQGIRCQKCGDTKNLQKVIATYDNEQSILIFCVKCTAAFERMKQKRAGADKSLTAAQYAMLVVEFLADKNPALEGSCCQKCGQNGRERMGRHHPYPQRHFGRMIILCNHCHENIEQEIFQQELVDKKTLRELPKEEYAKLTLRFISNDAENKRLEKVLSKYPHPTRDELEELRGTNQLLNDVIIELARTSVKIENISAYLKEKGGRRASWLLDKARKMQRASLSLQELKKDFLEIEDAIKNRQSFD